MQRYGVGDVAKLLRLSRNTIRALVAAGFVTPERGPRRAWLFSFQDLIVLRTAQALADAKVPQRRITRSVRELRRNLPASMPLSGLSIGAVGDRVVVREGGTRWQAETGQYLLGFEGGREGPVAVIGKAGAPAQPKAAPQEDWFSQGVQLEASQANAALRAYERAIAADPSHFEAHLNYGRLLHEARRLGDAQRAYLRALEHCGPQPLLLFNLGVLLEDTGHAAQAIQAYEAAIAADPDLADGHYNLALLHEAAGNARGAIRHMARYRKLGR